MAKNPSANTGNTRDAVSIPGSGRSPGGENCNPLQYPCLENPVDRGARWATLVGSWGHKELDMTEHELLPKQCSVPFPSPLVFLASLVNSIKLFFYYYYFKELMPVLTFFLRI